MRDSVTVTAISPLFARIDFKTLAPEIEKIRAEQAAAYAAEMAKTAPQETKKEVKEETKVEETVEKTKPKPKSKPKTKSAKEKGEDNTNPKKTDSVQTLNPTLKEVYNSVSNDGTYIDEIVEKTGFSTNEVLSALTMLEIKGLVQSLAGSRYKLN